MPLKLDADAEDLRVFLAEMEELLQLLDEDLVRLEREPDNTALLHEIFRAAHTIKGSAATIGHQQMAGLTHAMETLLDRLRRGELSITPAIVDTLLAALDALRTLKEEVATLSESGLDLTLLIAALQEHAAPDGTATPPARAATSYAVEPPGSGAAAEQGPPPVRLPASAAERRSGGPGGGVAAVYELQVSLAQNEWTAVRALQVLLEAGRHGRVEATVPPREEIEAGRVGGSLQLVVREVGDAQRLAAALEAIEDVTGLALYHRPEEQIGQEQAAEDHSMPAAAAGRSAATNSGVAGSTSAVGRNTGRPAKTVRIDVERLDTLMNLAGELVINRTRLAQLAAQLEERYGDDGLIGGLAESAQQVARITDRLQEEIMKSRMLPIETVFNRFPRLVRDLSSKLGKRVELVIHGQDTELDRSVLEEISDPLIHLLRNAVDHGIETPEERRAAGKPEAGTIRLAARHEDNHIVIELEDDGRGIDIARVKASAVERGLLSAEAAERLPDPQALRLIFEPGLSTARQVSDLSGRGVGMDIVRANIEKLNGTIDVGSAPGAGTRFTIKLPLTLAIIQALLVSVGGGIYAVPLAAVTETLRAAPHEIQYVNNREVIQLRGQVLPLVRLHAVLGCETVPRDGRYTYVVSVRMGQEQAGLIVDELLGGQEIVIKPLGAFLGEIPGIAGAALLGDGRLALIIDVLGLLHRETVRSYGAVVAQE
jgi:two-component system chemotaxis sensor kinase CheA